jgi:hypothetical protein
MKSACFLASKSDLLELNDVAAICYVFICKDALFSLHNIPSTLPSTITNLLQDYADVFPKEVPPIRGSEHRIDLISGLPCQTKRHTGRTQKKPRRFSDKYKNYLIKAMCVSPLVLALIPDDTPSPGGVGRGPTN